MIPSATASTKAAAAMTTSRSAAAIAASLIKRASSSSSASATNAMRVSTLVKNSQLAAAAATTTAHPIVSLHESAQLRSQPQAQRQTQQQQQQRRYQSSWARGRMASLHGASATTRAHAHRSLPATNAATSSRRPTIDGKSIPFYVQDLNTNSNMNSTLAASALSSSSASSSPDCNTTTPPTIQTPREYSSDLVVVLDLDECLIHTKFASQSDAHSAWQVLQRQQQSSSSSSSTQSQSSTSSSPSTSTPLPIVSPVDTFQIELPEGIGIVHERPHLHDFLREVSQSYETHLYTAALPVYAKLILQQLDPHQTIFTQAWYRDSCDFHLTANNKPALIKNLNRITTSNGIYQPKRTILVDNNPISFLSNPKNGILIDGFYNDPHDTSLLKVMDIIHELNSEGTDVRPKLDQQFGIQHILRRMMMMEEQQQEQRDEQDNEQSDHPLTFSQASALF